MIERKRREKRKETIEIGNGKKEKKKTVVPPPPAEDVADTMGAIHGRLLWLGPPASVTRKKKVHEKIDSVDLI